MEIDTNVEMPVLWDADLEKTLRSDTFPYHAVHDTLNREWYRYYP